MYWHNMKLNIRTVAHPFGCKLDFYAIKPT